MNLKYNFKKYFAMKLIELIENLETINDDLIIFQENLDDFNSEVILSQSEEGNKEIKIVNNKKYYYLIEVFLAKEFVDDWIQSLNHLPTENEIAKRLYDYAINDA